VIVASDERLFKFEIVEEPSKIYNVAREVKWFGYYMHQEENYQMILILRPSSMTLHLEV
jgi:hypothetical protein